MMASFCSIHRHNFDPHQHIGDGCHRSKSILHCIQLLTLIRILFEEHFQNDHWKVSPTKGIQWLRLTNKKNKRLTQSYSNAKLHQLEVFSLLFKTRMEMKTQQNRHVGFIGFPIIHSQYTR